jgi:voltage-gated potassium channel
MARKGRRCGPTKDTSVISILLALRRVGRAVIAVWRDPDTKALPFVAGALVLTGTIFYWRYEDWTFVQSLYFSVVTLTTVGYGDLTPTSDVARIFTIIYILTGLGVLVALLSALAQQYIRLTAERAQKHVSHIRHRHDSSADEGESR